MREKFGNVSFHIRRRSNEPLHATWQVSTRQVKRMIPGSGIMVRQFMGTDLATITLRLRLDSMNDYLALQAMLGRTSTLVLRSRFTNARGTTLYEDGETWEYLPNTTLDDLGEMKVELSGMVEVMATFQRAFDPATGGAG